MTVSPKPPASTTPASRRTGSRSGPRRTELWPASSARSSTSAISASWRSASSLGAQPRLGHVRELGGDAVGHLAHDGEDRALGRLAHGVVGAVGRAGHRGADQHGVDELAGAGGELLGGAADQLGEDDAGVAAGAEQRGAGDGVDDLVAADLVDLALPREPVELVEHGAQRERHVVARVAVGDREDVEVVDLLAAASSSASARWTTPRKRTRLGSAKAIRAAARPW